MNKKISVFIGIMLLAAALVFAAKPNPGHSAEEISGGTFSSLNGSFIFPSAVSVGVGVMSPTQKLDVSGNMNVSGNIYCDDLYASSNSVYIGGKSVTNNAGTLEWGGIGVGVNIAENYSELPSAGDVLRGTLYTDQQGYRYVSNGTIWRHGNGTVCTKC